LVSIKIQFLDRIAVGKLLGKKIIGDLLDESVDFPLYIPDKSGN
jgi:hypothetical protein